MGTVTCKSTPSPFQGLFLHTGNGVQPGIVFAYRAAVDGVAAMMTDIESTYILPTTRAPRSVLVVSEQAGRNIPNGVMDREGYDVIYVESMARAYSYAKQVSPDLVIMCISLDDTDACRVLSMLKLDSETCDIPVETYMTLPAHDASDESDEPRASAAAARYF